MTTAITQSNLSTRLYGLPETMQLGEILAQSGFFQDSREAAQCVTKIIAGREMGFGPIASMTGVNIIKGRVTLSANLLAAAVKRSGKYNYRVIEHTDTACEIEFSEGGQVIGTSRFTMDDAKQAQLGGDNWRKYPANMLFARAMSNGAKWHCPDIFGGPIYTPDELGANVDEEGEIIDATPRIVDAATGEVTRPTPDSERTPQTRADRSTDNPPKPSMADELPPAETEQARMAIGPRVEDLTSLAASLRSRTPADMPEGVRWEQQVYMAAKSDLGYKDEKAVKAALGVESIRDWTESIDAMLGKLIDNAPLLADAA